MNKHFVVDIDPSIISLGPLEVRWYGLMYVIGFIMATHFFKVLVKKGFLQIPEEKVDSLIMHIIVCMFLGARFAYVFIYNWDYYSQHLLELLAVWKGGLSYHGALVGLLVGGFIFARKNKTPWAQVMDSMALAGTQSVFFGRIGNFINGELYGRTTDVPWAMIFKGGGPYPRHPSQLYQSLTEGLLLWIILWFIFKRAKNYGVVASCYIIGYGFFRFIMEYFREADSQLGYYFGGNITMGQILCALMMIGGFTSLAIVKKRANKIELTPKPAD